MGFTWFVVAFAALLVALIVGVIVAVLSRFEFVSARVARRTIYLLMAVLAIDVVFIFSKHNRSDHSAIEITAIARPAWWDLRYTTPRGSFATANEMHVPVDRAVVVHCVSSRRHMVFVRGAHADRDVLLARETTLFVRAQQAAEAIDFSLDHLALRMPIIPDRDFDTWVSRQLPAAAPPSNRDALLGQEVFRTARCTYCHSVRGVAIAEEPIGPDLTHLGSRATLAAARLPNRRGYLAGWIVNPEAFERDSGMPANAMAPQRLQWLLAFLQELR